MLGPTERLRAAAGTAGPAAERLAGNRDALAARAAALRARAASLQKDVVDPARRDRLIEAGGR